MTGGGKMPWVPPKELQKMGYSMVLYSTSVLFPVVSTIQQSLHKLREGRDTTGVSMEAFSKLIGIPAWSEIEEKYPVQE
jgi:2-methylisocitrate lyase-like PEP mutase family enzyme